MRFEIFMAVKV